MCCVTDGGMSWSDGRRFFSPLFAPHFPVPCQSGVVSPRGGSWRVRLEPVKRQERPAGSGSRGPTASNALEEALTGGKDRREPDGDD
jgi:hypothetical protein